MNRHSAAGYHMLRASGQTARGSTPCLTDSLFAPQKPHEVAEVPQDNQQPEPCGEGHRPLATVAESDPMLPTWVHFRAAT